MMSLAAKIAVGGSAARIAGKVGYTSQSAFRYAFRCAFGFPSPRSAPSFLTKPIVQTRASLRHRTRMGVLKLGSGIAHRNAARVFASGGRKGLLSTAIPL